MKTMSVRPLPDRISLSLYLAPGGDKENEGWFFLSKDEWEKFKVNMTVSTEAIRPGFPNAWHAIDVYSPDDFEAAIRDLRRQKYIGGCMMEPL